MAQAELEEPELVVMLRAVAATAGAARGTAAAAALLGAARAKRRLEEDRSDIANGNKLKVDEKRERKVMVWGR